MIDVVDLGKRYGEIVALRSLSLRVEAGEIYGLLGPNGAGKSTTLKILTGMIRPDAGRASVAGFDVVEAPLEVKRRIGYVPESGALYESLTAGEQLEFVAALHHLDRAVASRRAGELLDVFDLAAARDRPIAECSKGMRQRLLIASALIHNPEVLLFDEPLDGLDAPAAGAVKALLRRLAAEGRTILFCSHILEVVERLCTRLLIIRDGSPVAEGTPADVIAGAGAATLDEAFLRLVGAAPTERVAADVLAALGRT